MSDDNSANSSSVILSFLLGGLTGAALAILFAPRSGRETREMLGERLRETAERGRELRDRAQERGREILNEATGYVRDRRETLEREKDRLAAAVEAGRQKYREEKDKA
jgi:gas vesicle protein